MADWQCVVRRPYLCSLAGVLVSLNLDVIALNDRHCQSRYPDDENESCMYLFQNSEYAKRLYCVVDLKATRGIKGFLWESA